jgi:hypothetical protein
MQCSVVLDVVVRGAVGEEERQASLCLPGDTTVQALRCCIAEHFGFGQKVMCRANATIVSDFEYGEGVLRGNFKAVVVFYTSI